ncbi:hypothetical protein MBLNU459_g7113t1 [Dothideomycetes sp. NU459]
MATVEHANLPSDARVDREHNRDSPAVKFTAVNGGGGGSNNSPPRPTSFRPEWPSSPDGHHQQSLPRQNGSSDPLFARQQAPEEQERNTQMALHHQSPLQHIPNLGKRKRSLEPSRSSSPKQARPEYAVRNGGLPASPELKTDSASDKPNQSYQGHAPILSRDQQWRPQQQPPAAMSEEQMASSLRDGMRAPNDKFDETEDRQESHENGGQTSYSPDTQPEGSVNGVRKPRKRNFSQRTKTGCHTCRERKKKCDEAKPECNNCLRGSFTCKGYGPKHELVKNPNARSIPLQSKGLPNHQGPAGYYPAHGAARPGADGWDEYPREYLSRPHTLDNEGVPIQRRWSRHPYAPSNEHDGSYGRDDSPRSGYDRSSFSDRRPQPPLFRPLTVSSSSSVDMTQSALTAQLALQHSSTACSTSQLGRMTEKEKMLVGRPYRHYVDNQLVDERTSCRAALDRFNNASSPSAGVGHDERGKLFRQIVEPDNPMRMRHPRDPVGRVGFRVIVEAPFTCEFGYNINIGDNVLISAGCYIQDCCKITIGSNTVIGPNVKFYGLTAPMDPKLRNGTQGLFYAGTIVIEEDCFIGGDVVILPHRTIRKGSVVGAGTVVSKDVQANTIVAGNPMRVIRGIGPTADDAHKDTIQAENEASIRIQMADRYPHLEGRDR